MSGLNIIKKKEESSNENIGALPISEFYKKLDVKLKEAKKKEKKEKIKNNNNNNNKNEVEKLVFHLKEPKIQFHMRGKKIMQQQKMDSIFIGRRPIDAARKAFSDIARSYQLQGKTDQNISFILVEYKNDKPIREYYYIGSNLLDKPYKKVIKQDKGPNKIIYIYVKPTIKKIDEREL